MDRNVTIVNDLDGKKFVLINDIRFRAKKREDWKIIEEYLKDAKYGWYRYNVRFALPVYDDQIRQVVRYNMYSARMLVRHSEDGKKYLYDLLAIKKKRAARFSYKTVR